METAGMRQKLAAYLKVADENKIKAIYTMVEDEINTSENEWSENFIKELKQRSRGIADGIIKTYSWEETKKAAIKKVRSSKRI